MKFSQYEYDPVKLLNKSEKVASIFRVRDARSHFDPTFPISVELHLTNKCNLKCRWCTDKQLHQHPASLSMNVITKTLQEFALNKVGVTLEGGGEPTLHEHFSDIVNYGNEIGLEFGLITNGTSDISDTVNGFKWVRVSLDSSNEQEYIKEKGINLFSIARKNIERMIQANNTQVNIGVGFVITKRNQHHLRDLILELNDIGVDYIYCRPVEENLDDLPDFEPLFELKREYDNTLNEHLNISVLLKLIERTESDNAGLPCIANALTSIIRADGSVVLCEKRRHDIQILGNLNDTSFSEIWLSGKRIDICKKLLDPVAQKGCATCRLTSFNKMFYGLKNIRSKNFI